MRHRYVKSWRKRSPARKMANAKALGKEYVWALPGTGRRPVWLEQQE